MIRELKKKIGIREPHESRHCKDKSCLRDRSFLEPRIFGCILKSHIEDFLIWLSIKGGKIAIINYTEKWNSVITLGTIHNNNKKIDYYFNENIYYYLLTDLCQLLLLFLLHQLFCWLEFFQCYTLRGPSRLSHSLGMRLALRLTLFVTHRRDKWSVN